VVIAIREANVSFGETDWQGLESPIASRLAYTQKSEGRTFPGDQPSLCELRLARPLLAAP
jgi:hypothetical protein